MRLTRYIALFAIALSAACTTASTEPTDIYHGTWNGTVNDRVAGAGTIELIVPGPGIAGMYTITLQSGVTLSGTTSNYNLLSGKLNIPFACPPVNGVFVLQLDGDRLKGDYNAAGCQVLSDGTVDVGR